MMKRNTKLMGCSCSGYHFFHRKGSLYCWYRSDGTDRYPGDPDFVDRFADILFDDMLDEDSDIPFDLNDFPPAYENHGEATIPF